MARIILRGQKRLLGDLLKRRFRFTFTKNVDIIKDPNNNIVNVIEIKRKRPRVQTKIIKIHDRYVYFYFITFQKVKNIVLK